MSKAQELTSCDAVELAAMIASGQISPVEAVQAALDRLDAVEPHLNAFSHVMRDEAIQEARSCEQIASRGDVLPPLFGVPISVKDLIAVKDAPLAFGSKAFSNNCANEDAPAVARLRAAGAIVIGKTTTSELGCKAVGSSPLTGFTRNPWDLSKTAGGSSAGAGASVAAGVTPVAIGTDGGGSIRIPAALNGLFGFKAQFGRIPVYPHSATPELAHVAPLGRSVRDVAIMLQIMSGPDVRDPGSLWQATANFTKAINAGTRKLRIAWSPSFGYATPDEDVLKACKLAVQALERIGCTIDLVEDPLGEDPADAWSQIFYTQVARRYGHLLKDSPDQIDPAVLAIVQKAAKQSALTFAEALATRRRLHDRLSLIFDRYDVLVSPTLPVASVKVGIDVPETLNDRNLVTWASYTYPFNLTGHPAASIPAGFNNSGLPIGLQLVGKPACETELLALCAAYEALRPWPKIAPESTCLSKVR